MRIYISGAITENPNAVSEFKAAALIVKERGDTPVNPMELNHDHDGTWASYMITDLKALKNCQAILMLPGWEKSPGARIEKQFAERAGLWIFKLVTNDNKTTSEIRVAFPG